MHVPEGWNSNELGKLIIEGKKSALKVSDAANFGQYPFFTSGEAVFEHVDKLTDGENIYLATGGIANIKFFDGDASYSTDTYAIRTSDEIETKYLYFDLLSIIDYINANYFQGSGLKHLQKKDFKKHRILYPNERIEQNQIVTILSKVDEAISQTDKLIAKYSRIKTGLMQDLLTKGLDENGKIRSEKTHEFKDSPLGRIPIGWGVDSIESLRVLITSGSRGWAKYYAEEGSQFIRITNLRRKQIEIDKSDLKFVNLPLSAEGIRSKLIEGDLLISITADLGIIGVVPPFFGNAFINQHIALVRLDPKVINSKFAGYFLSSHIGQSMFKFLNDGGAKAGLNLKTIGQLLVIKPSMTEQIFIIEKIEKQNNDVINLNQHLSKLKSVKTGLMQDLLSGKVRVKHLLKEATSV